MTAGAWNEIESFFLQLISWESHEHLRAKNSNTPSEPLYISLGDVMPRLWLPNILEGHFPCCGGTLVTCWHVVLKEVQNSNVGFLHPIVYPALPFVNIPFLATSFNDSY